MIIVHFESCITNRELSWLVGSPLCSLVSWFPAISSQWMPCPDRHTLWFFLAAKHKTKRSLESSWGSLLQRLPIFLLQGRPCLPKESFYIFVQSAPAEIQKQKSLMKIFVLCSSLLIDHINDRKQSWQTPKLSQLYFLVFSVLLPNANHKILCFPKR